MLPVNAFTIRPAAAADADALGRLAVLDSRRPLTGAVLVAEHDGVLVAALGLDDRRAIADPFRATASAVLLLRTRADALAAVQRTPLLGDRLRAAVRVSRRLAAPSA